MNIWIKKHKNGKYCFSKWNWCGTSSSNTFDSGAIFVYMAKKSSLFSPNVGVFWWGVLCWANVPGTVRDMRGNESTEPGMNEAIGKIAKEQQFMLSLYTFCCKIKPNIRHGWMRMMIGLFYSGVESVQKPGWGTGRWGRPNRRLGRDISNQYSIKCYDVS